MIGRQFDLESYFNQTVSSFINVIKPKSSIDYVHLQIGFCTIYN